MPITPQIYRYRQDPLLDLQMTPIKHAFFGDENVRNLKLETDKLGVRVTEDELVEFMNNAYAFDDEVQKVELNVAIGGISMTKVLPRLNQAVLDEIRRRLVFGGREFHQKFTDTTMAFMGDDYKRLYDDFYSGSYQRATRFTRTRNARDQSFW